MILLASYVKPHNRDALSAVVFPGAAVPHDLIEGTSVTPLYQLPTRPEAEALREIFLDESAIVANAIADLLTTPQPEVPPAGLMARARAAIDAEEAEHGPLTPHDRRRTRFVSASSGIVVELIRHALHTRDAERRKASRQR